VFGQTALGTKMSSEGTDRVERAGVHDLTVAKPEAISKDIDAGSSDFSCSGWKPFASLRRRGYVRFGGPKTSPARCAGTGA
jgi:hypothetical protein